MARFMIEVSHEPSQCLETLDHYAAETQQLLEEAEFGCKHGVHAAWVNVEANSEDEARTMLPMSQRPGARIVQVEKFTPENIRRIHQAA